MPVNRRHLIGLGGAAAVSVGAAAFLVPRGAETPGTDEAVLAFPNLAPRLAGARKVEIRQGSNTLVLDRQGETWVLPAKGGYPARGERVREMLAGLTELRLAERRTSDPEALDRLGLGEPGAANSTAALLRVLDGNGAPIAELITGRRRMRTQGGVPESIYVRRPSENQSYLAEGRVPVDADSQLWVDRDVVNLPRERVQRVISVRDGRTIEMLRQGGSDTPLSIVLPGDAPPADDIALDEVSRAFEGLTFLDVRPEAQIPGSETGQGRFVLTDNLTVNARVNIEGGDVWVRLAAIGDEEASRLNARWRGWAYQVGAWKAKAFAPSLDELRARSN
ncbi:DUF4340 domain-containing protein [Roseomonas sp. CCTCC AB2023176]|uniref:DUF4340 domain-containing protein n=1 Tax=Roseomonas sp. CCTCC AB2023176 TaxID=3342640 RepID=UPI0035E166FC